MLILTRRDWPAYSCRGAGTSRRGRCACLRGASSVAHVTCHAGYCDSVSYPPMHASHYATHAMLPCVCRQAGPQLHLRLHLHRSLRQRPGQCLLSRRSSKAVEMRSNLLTLHGNACKISRFDRPISPPPPPALLRVGR